MSEETKFKVMFAPGVLEDMENKLSTEELQEFMDMIKDQIADGSFLENSEPVDMDKLQTEHPEQYQQLIEALDEFDELDIEEHNKKLN